MDLKFQEKILACYQNIFDECDNSIEALSIMNAVLLSTAEEFLDHCETSTKSIIVLGMADSFKRFLGTAIEKLDASTKH